MPFYLAEQQLLAVLGSQVALLNSASIMVSLRVLGGSTRRLRDFIPVAVKLPVFAPP
jgi:hypothetical protein